MTQRLNDYFAAEATEYLEQLDALLALAGRPDMDHFLRLATGVRGSAQMAGAETVAGVAERLEDAARSIVSSNVAWSDEIRALSQQTVADLKLLVRALNRWGEEEERRVREAILRWDDVDRGAPAAGPRLVADDEPPAAVPIESLFFDDTGPHVIEPSSSVPVETVPIQQLLLRGDRALVAALALRPELEDLLRDRDDSRDLLAELFDLIELGRDSQAPAE